MWFSQNKNLILSKTITAIHDYNSCSQFNFIFGNSNIHVLFTVLNDDKIIKHCGTDDAINLLPSKKYNLIPFRKLHQKYK